MRGGAEIETDQINYRVTAELGDSSAERSIALGSLAIEGYMLDRLPFRGVVIWPAFSAGNRDYFMTLVYKTRHQPGADMSCRSDDYGAQV